MNRSILRHELKVGTFLEYRADPGRFVRLGKERFKSKRGKSPSKCWYYQIIDHNGIMIMSRVTLTDINKLFRKPLDVK